MKFYGNGIVWDPAANRPLVQFGKDGTLEVTDKDVCDRLIERGYKYEKVIVTEQKPTAPVPVEVKPQATAPAKVEEPITAPTEIVEEAPKRTRKPRNA